MDRERALLILQCEDHPEAIEEAYEQILFTEKQFFFTRTPTPSVFEKRLQKVERAERAFTFLTERSLDDFQVSLPELPEAPTLDEVLNHQTIVKNALLSASSARALQPLVEELLNTEARYEKIVWEQLGPIAEKEMWEEQTVARMQKVDIMELKEALDHLEKNGSTEGLAPDLKAVLAKEYNRLQKPLSKE